MNKLLAETDAFTKTTIAQAEVTVAEKKSEAYEIEGRSEAELAKLLQSRRNYEVNMRRLGVLKAMSENPNVVVYGSSQDNLLSQVAAFRVAGMDHLLPK